MGHTRETSPDRSPMRGQPADAWATLREALRAGAPGQRLLLACRNLREWIDLPAPDGARRLRAALGDEADARWLLQARPVVSTRLVREALPPGVPPTPEAFGALDAAVQQELARRLGALQRIGDEAARLFPSAAAPTPPPAPAMDALAAAIPALQLAIRRCSREPGHPERLEALDAAIGAFAAAARTWPPPLPLDHAWWLGMARYELGRVALAAGDVPRARAAFVAGAADFDRAAVAEHAADLRQRVAAIDAGGRADFDALAAPPLRALLEPREPLARMDALADLASAAGDTGDGFEAARLARELAGALIAAGYADPQADVQQAVHAWVETAVAELQGDAVLERVSRIAKYWAVVLGARAGARLTGQDQAAATDADPAEDCLRDMGTLVMGLFVQSQAVSDEIGLELAEWFGTAAVADTGPGLPWGDGGLADGRAVDRGLERLRLACNAGPDEAQVTEARRLLAAAEGLGSRVHRVSALLELAYVLLALGRHAEVLEATAEALRVLIPTGPASLDAVAVSHERELYLRAVQSEARARIGLGDRQGVLDLCERVIREIESQRVHVSTPYQQAAFLASRAEFYEYCAAAAWRLGRTDLLIATTERLKASRALGRVGQHHASPDPAQAQELAALDRQYADANRALAALTPGDPAATALRERRRRIAAARTILLQGAAPPLPPPPTLAALQKALAPDEAAISWFWLSETAILALALTADTFGTALIELTGARLTALDSWLDCMRAFTDPALADDWLIPRLDQLIAELGPALFPDELRPTIEGRSRLVLSPHRALHLFPFHAVPWWPTGATPRAGDPPPPLIASFAIRYAPNLTGLTIPWSGQREGQVLAVGIGDFGATGLPPLQNTATEVAAVAALHGAAGRALTDLSRAEFTALPFADYRCLHLATHGSSVLVGEALDDPLDCGIALADGILDGWQLADLRLPAELVVLAACYSGQRSIGGRGLVRFPGDDLFGLQAVLFEAGAGTLLGALWPVDDYCTRAIMTSFHRAYAAGSPPELALQAAVLAWLRGPNGRSGAFAWAPFFLTALRNPRPPAGPDPGHASGRAPMGSA